MIEASLLHIFSMSQATFRVALLVLDLERTVANDRHNDRPHKDARQCLAVEREVARRVLAVPRPLLNVNVLLDTKRLSERTQVPNRGQRKKQR